MPIETVALGKTTWTMLVRGDPERITLKIQNASASTDLHVTDRRAEGIVIGDGGYILYGTESLNLNVHDNESVRNRWYGFAAAAMTVRIYTSHGLRTVTGPGGVFTMGPGRVPPGGNGRPPRPL